jgi:hypothetical protein
LSAHASLSRTRDASNCRRLLLCPGTPWSDPPASPYSTGFSISSSILEIAYQHSRNCIPQFKCSATASSSVGSRGCHTLAHSPVQRPTPSWTPLSPMGVKISASFSFNSESRKKWEHLLPARQQLLLSRRLYQAPFPRQSGGVCLTKGSGSPCAEPLLKKTVGD